MGPDNNGHTDERPPDIPFGDAPGNVLSPMHAEAVLRLMWDRHRAQLAALIGEAYTGVKPTVTRTRG